MSSAPRTEVSNSSKPAQRKYMTFKPSNMTFSKEKAKPLTLAESRKWFV